MPVVISSTFSLLLLVFFSCFTTHPIAKQQDEMYSFLGLEASRQRSSIDEQSEERTVSVANFAGREEKESGSGRCV